MILLFSGNAGICTDLQWPPPPLSWNGCCFFVAFSTHLWPWTHPNPSLYRFLTSRYRLLMLFARFSLRFCHFQACLWICASGHLRFSGHILFFRDISGPFMAMDSRRGPHKVNQTHPAPPRPASPRTRARTPSTGTFPLLHPSPCLFVYPLHST